MLKAKIAKNIKRVLLILAIFVSGFLIGFVKSEVKAVPPFDMVALETDLVNWVGDFYLYEDSETHVEYMVYKDSNTGIAITPRFNADGSLYVKGK